MADNGTVTIGALPAAGPLLGSELVAAWQAGATVGLPVGDFATATALATANAAIVVAQNAATAAQAGVDRANRGRVVNVFDYFPANSPLVGQIQAGTLTDYTSIDTYVQAAVSAVNAAPFAGGVLYFPAGRWQLTQQIWIKRGNTYVVGDGMIATLLIFADGDGSDALRIASAAWVSAPATLARLQYVGVEGLTLSGRGGTNGYANRVGLRLGGCGFEGKLRDVEFHGWGYNGTVCEDAWDWNVIGCKWTSNGNNFAVGATLPRAISFRAVLDNTNAMKFFGCHWEGNTQGTFDINGRSNSLIFVGNKFERNGLGTAGAVDEIVIDNNLADGFIFTANFVSRDSMAAYWLNSIGKGVIVTGNSLRGPSETQGSLWFFIGTTGATRVVAARIFGNQIYAKGDLGKAPFDFRGVTKFSYNDVRISNPTLGFNVAGTSSEVTFNDITQLGATTGTFLYTVTDGNVYKIRDNTYTNAFATIGFDTTTVVSANTRGLSDIEFLSRGNTSGSSVAVSADGFDPLGYGDGYTFNLAASLAVSNILKDRIGKLITLVIPNTSTVGTGGNIKVGGGGARSGGILTLKKVLFSSNDVWQEVDWVSNILATKSWTPGAIAAGASVSTTLTTTGAALGDPVAASFNISLAGCTLSASVSAVSTTTAVITNNTGASVTLGAGTLKAVVNG